MPWSYTEDLLKESVTRENEDGTTEHLTPVTKQPVDLATGPPSYQERFDADSKKVRHGDIALEYAELILGLRPANEKHRYKVTVSLIGWAQT